MVCLSGLLLGRYEGAVTACEQAAANDSWWTDQVYLAAVYAQLRDSAKSAAAKAALFSERPGFTIEKLKTTMNWGGAPGYRQRLETHLYAGLRTAGIPEK